MLLGSLVLSRYSAKFSVGIAYSVNAICIALLAWAAMRTTNRGFPVCSTIKYLILFGAMSYSLYLWQQFFLNPHNGGILCGFPLNLFLALLAGFHPTS